MVIAYLFLVVVLLLSILRILKYYKYRRFYKIPGPPGLPLLGVLQEMSNAKELSNKISVWHNKYGPVIRFNTAHYEWLVVAEPELIEFFLRSAQFLDRPYPYALLKPWLGDGMLTAETFSWHKTRKLAIPVFNVKNFPDFMQVFNSASDVLINVLDKKANEEKFDINPIITAYTLDIILETATGFKLNTQENPVHDYFDAVHRMESIVMNRSFSVWKMHDFLFKFSNDYKNQENAMKVIDNLTMKVIEERKKILFENKSTPKNIALDILLTGSIDGKPLSMKKMRDEINSLIFGGHDTTAATISLMLYQLSINPIVQNTIVEELKDIFGSDSDRAVSMADANEMKYMEMVIKEVLRFYTVVPQFGRVLKEDVNCNGILLPKGLILAFFLKTLNHSPKYYEEPEKFNPERFLPSNSLPPYTFIPFSTGPRNCKGQKYAMYEMKVTVSKLLRKFELLPAGPGHELDLHPEMVMKAPNGVVVRIKHRKF